MEKRIFKVLVEGHIYDLDSAGGTDTAQKLLFIHKAKTDQGELILVSDGTTTEAVIAVLIDRLTYLDSILPSAENEVAIAALKLALKALNERTTERAARGVEGTHAA